MRPALLDDTLAFPNIDEALEEPNGLLAVGGDLSVARLCLAYRLGIFPWYNEGEAIIWWSPNPRNVLIPSDYHVSKSSRKAFRKCGWHYSINRSFEAVISACANDRAAGTWINNDMYDAYCELHQTGFAHSVEIWHNNQLIGGIYGVKIDRMFFAESMFSRASNASKAALLALCAHCLNKAVGMIDCQLESEHLNSLGAQPISRAQFSDALAMLACDSSASRWYAAPTPLANLLN